MSFPSHTSNSIEVEAKFLGGEEEFGKIVGCLEQAGFSTSSKPPIHRMHVYFDHDSKLREAGCRLRCIIAAGEWIRYDFKIDDPSGGRETIELSWKLDQPRPLDEVAEHFLGKLGSEAVRRILEAARPSLGVALAMAGVHVKTMATRDDGVELEVSWDVLADLTTGRRLSEIEVELAGGDPAEYERVITRIESDTGLRQDSRSKLARMLGLG